MIKHTGAAMKASLCACAAIALLTGCVTPQTQSEKASEAQAAATTVRLQESERLNGRLTVRIEELEDQVFLLQDRVEANRLSLQRRGYMRGAVAQGLAQAAPAPAAARRSGSQLLGACAGASASGWVWAGGGLCQ